MYILYPNDEGVMSKSIAKKKKKIKSEELNPRPQHYEYYALYKQPRSTKLKKQALGTGFLLQGGVETEREKGGMAVGVMRVGLSRQRTTVQTGYRP